MPSPSILLRPRLTAAVAAIALSLAGLAGAQPAEDEQVRKARDHYKQGEEAFAAGRYDEAYREFESGYQLAPRPVFLLNMAHSERRRGDLKNARALYKKFLLVDPESKYRGEVEQVLQELDNALAAEEAARPTIAPPTLAPAPPPVVAPPLVTTPPVTTRSGSDQEYGEPRPLYRRWWFWAAIGGAVAAAVVTGVALSSSGDGGYVKDGSLTTLRP